MTPDDYWGMTPREFSAWVEGWNWRNRQQRIATYEGAYLRRVNKLPTLDGWLDPPRTRRLTPAQADQAKTEFEKAKAISDRVPVRPRTDPTRQPQPPGRPRR